MADKEQTCGDCEHYLYYTSTGMAEGWCKAYPGSEGDLGKIVRYNTGANDCAKFQQIENVITDTSQFEYHPHLRAYGEHEEKKADVNVDAVLDESCWG